MTFFKINDKLAIGAEVYETRYSWGHKANLYRVRTPEQSDEWIIGDKITYYNRTWERYQFESILYSIVAKALKKHLITPEEAQTCNDYIKNYQDKNDKWLGTVAHVAKLGEILAPDQKARNDWKTRMLKAGLEGQGLIMPEDWDQLSEDEKERRLNGAISTLEEGK